MAVRRPPGVIKIGISSREDASDVPNSTDKSIDSSIDSKTEETVSDTPSKNKKSFVVKDKKRFAITLGLQFLGLILFIVGISLNVKMAVESQPNEEKVAVLVEEYNGIQDQIRSTDASIGALPSAAVAKRWTEAATTHGDAVALRQTGLIFEASGLSYEGIPTEYEKDGEREPVKYTDAERRDLALRASEERVQSYLREMTSLFSAVDADERGFSAAGPWYRQLEIEPNSSFTWKFSASGYFEKDGTMPVAWTLYDGENKPLALVEATYDTEKRVFVDLSASKLLPAVGDKK